MPGSRCSWGIGALSKSAARHGQVRFIALCVQHVICCNILLICRHHSSSQRAGAVDCRVRREGSCHYFWHGLRHQLSSHPCADGQGATQVVGGAYSTRALVWRLSSVRSCSGMLCCLLQGPLSIDYRLLAPISNSTIS